MTTNSVPKFAGGDDTIAAIATANGRGAVALVRVSGPNAFAIAAKIGAPMHFDPRVAMRFTVRHPDNEEPLDDALITRFVGPHSFTGENVVEISTHGGMVVPASVLIACITAGARQAQPGEFTRRALLNGRVDMLQAEAIADLVDARTHAMQEQALAQLDGGLSRRLLALRGEIIGLEVLLAYDIDFPEEDDGPIAPMRIANSLRDVKEQLEALLATAPRAALVRDGALVVIAGPPNAGKSSLFNALLGEARALVTEIPGTTRDAIEAFLDTPGLPLRLVDTAGLRNTDDVLERLGIEVSERYLAHAQLVLACSEDVDGLRRTIERVRPLTGVPVIAVLTKADVHQLASNGNGGVDERSGDDESRESMEMRKRFALEIDAVPTAVVSAENGTGLRALLALIVQQILRDVGGVAGVGNATPLTRERHRVAIATALEEVIAFESAWIEDAVPATVAAVHLHAAANLLHELVGSISVDDVLDKLFRDFCVGK